ncbi:hypothetical protein ACH4FX_38155 [Streptomyces sp. NPDC018019]|uniref:hypothetical protein n=1 Tax=Streptomyces sp. NPDC018019 TaxID=3365030 RepID=UPI003797622A
MTDADGDKSNLTFEVWTADAAGKPKTKAKIADNEYGVIVSPDVASGSTVTVDVPAGKLSMNTNYVFHTSAYDGSLYETNWSPWAKFRVELPVDLTLPTPDYTAPDPSSFDVPPTPHQTKPLGAMASLKGKSAAAAEQCGPVDDNGRRVCFGTPVPKDKAPKKVAKATTTAAENVPWCNTDFTSILATRHDECDVRVVPVVISMDGVPQATAYFTFLRLLRLDGQNRFTEHLTIEPAQQIPLDFAEINLKLTEHLCQGSCNPVEPGPDAWTAKTWWTPGDMHSTSLTTPYRWDASVAGQKYLYKPDVKIDADILPSSGVFVGAQALVLHG